KLEGQSNFVNPGLDLVNFGMDFELTPKARLITNANFLWFDDTNTIEQFIFQGDINRSIGADLSMGLEYRPFLNNRAIVTAGVSSLIPGKGFHEIYDPLVGNVPTMFATFVDLALSY